MVPGGQQGHGGCPGGLRADKTSSGGAERPEVVRHVTSPGSGGAAGLGAMSSGAGDSTGDGNGAESGAERRVRIVVEYW